MGAVNFTQIATGEDAHDAYNKACEEAREYYSDQPGCYGKITTTNGFEMFSYPGRVMTDKGIEKFENELWGWTTQYGPAACYELKGKRAKEFKENSDLKGTRIRVFVFVGWAAQ